MDLQVLDQTGLWPPNVGSKARVLINCSTVLCPCEMALREDTMAMFQDPPCTLNWGYMVPNNGYLGHNRG